MTKSLSTGIHACCIIEKNRLSFNPGPLVDYEIAYELGDSDSRGSKSQTRLYAQRQRDGAGSSCAAGERRYGSQAI